MLQRARLFEWKFILLLALTILAGACNLTSAPEEQLALTEIPTNTPASTGVSNLPTGSVPTTLPIGTLSIPTTQPLQLPPTSISLPATFIPFPTSTPLPISIFILSPIPGNVVAGNVQVLGAAIHPQFLQYQLEYGPDPNPGNLWYPATGIVQTPILNGLLGIWNTTVVQDSSYQLRLRVTLRDGTSLATVVNNIRIQNQAPTPIPSATPNIPRPIAAFTQDRTAGQAPLIVKFQNQSSGTITAYSWSFGDGGSSAEANPTYTFRNPGVFTVALSVAGPGGTSNVSRQINVQSATAPVAGFTQDKTTGPSPLVVKFTNQSTGTITAYSWTFGDGQTSTEQNPSHTFNAVGTYNVILSVTGPGGTSFVTRKITVEDPVIPPPVATFAVDKSTGNAPLTVQFSNQSTGQITSYNWDFGDGQNSADTNPSHLYSNPGTYTVVLTAIGPGGQSTAKVTITVTQPPNAPNAAFTQDKTSGDIPLAVQFTDQSTGDITTYAWTFGDGQSSTDKNPAHSYTAAGTYTVTLKVTGPGGSDEAQTTITATQPIAKPKAAFTANPTTGNAPLSVQFTNQSTGESLTYAWDFGDGSPASSDASPSHTFNALGSYTVKLTVSNAGGSDSTQANITVTQPSAAPIAGFSANPTTGTAPLNVQFTSTSTGDITTYAWNFGDGLGSSTDVNPAYSYANPGSYTVTLTVTGPGGSNSTSGTITVSQAALPPVAGFSANPTTGTAPLNVQFTSTSTGDITTYAWNFGDGIGSSSDVNPAYNYANPGSYTISLTVAGPGGSNSATTTVTVNQVIIPPPIAGFSANPTTGTAPLNVQFTSTSTGDITTYTWDFGDGLGSSSDVNPAYSYANPGSYTVTLTVTGPGGSNSTTGTITVSQAALPPVAGFSANPTTGTAPLNVQFTSTSTGDITTYTWDFGDGLGSSTDVNPFYSYANPGSYTVTLTVTGPGGSNSTTGTITVSQATLPPVAGFSANPTTGTAPLNVQFTSTSTGDITTYAWDFGDGVGSSVDVNPVYSYANPGSYTITLTVTGPGGSNSTTGTITVSQAAVAPTASFDANPPSGNAPLDVQFTSTSTGDITTYAWDFGDGIGSSSDVNPAYSYANPGSYTVTLTVTGPGGSNSATTTITVNQATVLPPINDPIAFTSDRTGNNEIYILGTDGALTNITNSGANDHSPAWSPDRSHIAFVSDRDGNNEIYLMGADGSNIQRLTNNRANDQSPAWSANGALVVYVTDQDGNNEIYAVNSGDGSNATNLTNNPANDNSPAPSPDGNGMAFVTDRDGNSEIYIANPDGSVTNITNDASSDSTPAWSANSTQIIFISDREGRPQIYVMNSDGSGVQRLSDNSADEDEPAWSSDSSQVIFISGRDGYPQIYVMSSDGSGVERVSDGSANDRNPVWQP